MAPPPFKQFTGALSAGFLLLLSGHLGAVQVYGTSGTGSAYTTAPADDFGFANVAKIYDPSDGFYTSGVYLGNGWMISAYHEVRNGSGGFLFGNVILDGSNYSVNVSTAVRITNPSTNGSGVDLAMYQLMIAPADSNLKTLVVSGTVPAVNSNLIMMGNGLNRAAALTFWSVNQSTNPWTWTQTPQTHGSSIFSGYFYDAGQSLRWGTGVVAGTLSGDDGFGVTSLLYSIFQSNNGDAVVAVGDSGGGVFFKSGSTWELSGILVATGIFSGQPSNTSIVGDVTYAADLSYYSGQINSIAALQAPSITTQPASLTIIEGGSATFTMAATGTPPPGYQWQRLPTGSGTWSSMTDISGTYAGAASGVLNVGNASLAMSGDQFRCVAANGTLPNATSNAVTLTVQTGYAAWFASKSGTAPHTGPAAIPQNDGIPNALKYLCDINPSIPMSSLDRSALPVAGIVTVGGNSYLTLTYRQNQHLPGLTLSVQTGADLQTWTTVIPDSTQTIGTDALTGDPIIRIEVKSNAPPKMFLRLLITIS